MQFIFAYTDSIDEQVHNIVDDGVLIVGLCDQFQHIFIIFIGQVQPDDVQTVIQESRKNTRLRVPLVRRQQNMVYTINKQLLSLLARKILLTTPGFFICSPIKYSCNNLILIMTSGY